MTPQEFQKHLSQVQIKLNRALKTAIPKIIGNKAVSLYKKNFREEGYFGEPWKEVKRRQNRTIAYKTKKGKVKTKQVKVGKGAAGTRAILTGSTGDLRRSIQYKVEAGKVIIYSDRKYSRAHNEGSTTAGRGNKTTIPKRQFMGEHSVITYMVEQAIKDTFNNILKP